MSVSLDVSANRGLAAELDRTEPPPSPARTDETMAAPQPSAPELFWNPQIGRIAVDAAAANGAGGAPGTSFDAQVRGTEPKPIDLTLAKLCKDVGTLPEACAPPRSVDGWTRLDDGQLRAAGIDPASLEDPSTGFRAAVYQNAEGEHVLAFAGSNDAKDWTQNNIPQGLGLPAAQYDQAVALATKAKAAFGDGLVITGHSLGGGLASVASVATDSAAVTFNAAGLSDATIRRLVPDADVGALKQQAADGLIRRYAVDGDVLTGEQETGALQGVMPDALGHKIELNDPSPLPWYEELPGVNLISDSAHGVTLHGIDSVLSALQKDHPWAPDASSGAGVVGTISNAIGDGAEVLSGGVDALKRGIESGIGGVTGTIAGAAGHVPLAGGVLKAAVDDAGRVLKGAVGVGGGLLEGAIGLGGHLLQGADRFVGGGIEALADGAKTVGGWAVDGAKAAGGTIVDGAKALGHAASKALPWNW